MRGLGIVVAAGLAVVSSSPVWADGELTFGDSHVYLLWEDANGFSDDVSKTEGPIAGKTDIGRSLQMVVDVIVKGEPNTSFEVPPVLKVAARSTAAGDPLLFEKSWEIRSIGDFGTAMRSFIVDHNCEGVTVDATVEVGGAVSDSWQKRLEIVCMDAS